MEKQEFFDKLQESVKTDIELPSHIKCKNGYGYCYFGSKDTHFECYFDEKTKSLRIGMHFENSELFDIVWNFRDVIENKIKEEIITPPNDKHLRAIGIKDKKDCELSEEDVKWAAEKMKNFYNAIIGEPKRVMEALGKS